MIIQMQVNRIGPANLTSTMKQKAMANRMSMKQQMMHTNLLQQDVYSYRSMSSSLSSYFLSALPFLLLLLFLDSLSLYLRSQSFFCRLQRNQKHGTKRKQRIRKDKQRQIMLSMKASLIKTLMTENVLGLQVDIRHIQINANYPKPKPQSKGPKRSIQLIFQQLLLERAIDPVAQMKNRIVQRGQRNDMTQAPFRTLEQQLSPCGIVNRSYMIDAARDRVVRSEKKIIMGYEGLKLVCRRRYYLRVIFLRSAMQTRGALATFLIILNIRILFSYLSLLTSYDI